MRIADPLTMPTLFGTSAPQRAGETLNSAVARIDTTLDPAIVRVYLDTPELGGLCISLLRTGASLALSFKNWDDAKVKALIASLPKDRLTILTYHHEPEDDIDAGHLDLDVWRQRQVKLAQYVVDAGRVGQVRPAVILMSWAIRNPKPPRPVETYAANGVKEALQAAGGIWGWDAYFGGEDGTYRDAKIGLMALAAKSTTFGLPWGVFETGVATVLTTGSPCNVTAVASFWTDVLTFLGSGKIAAPVCFLYWNQDNSPKGPNYILDSHPELLAVWKNASQIMGTAAQPADPPPPAPTYTQAQLDAAVAAAVAPLNALNTALTAAAATASQELATEQARSTGLQTQLSDLQAQFSAAQATISGDESHVADLQGQLDTQAATLADTQRQLSVANAQLVTVKQTAATSDAAKVKAQAKLKALLTAADTFGLAVVAAKKP